MEVIELEEWKAHTKTQYQMARVAAEVRAIREGLSKSPKSVTVEDCLVKFFTDGQPAPAPPVNGRPPGGLELGQPLDEKWGMVNANAKAVWAARLGRG